MRDGTGQTDSVRKLVLRDMGGVDRSIPTQFSVDTFYELLNLRPNRGSLEQTDLIGSLIGPIGVEP